MLDLKPHSLRITLKDSSGNNPLDVSALYESFDVANTHLDQSGLIKTDGKLVLFAYPYSTFGESLNPKLNPSRFARGCRVDVERYVDGAWQQHPRGRLRILKTPKPPDAESKRVEIEIGCLLTLQDFRVPPTYNPANTVLGTSQNRTSTINELADKAGIGHLQDTITRYPLNYPLFQENGSYVESMGKVAYAAGYVLWIDYQEKLRATRINTGLTPFLSLRTDEDTQKWQHLEPSETPCHQIKCTCTAKIPKSRANPPDSITTVSTPDYPIAEKVITEYSNWGTLTPETQITTYKPLGLLFPALFPKNQGLIAASIVRNTKYFTAASRRLDKITEITFAPKGLTLSTFYPGAEGLDTIKSKQVDTFYEFQDYQNYGEADPDNPPVEPTRNYVIITTKTYLQKGAIDPDNTSIGEAPNESLASVQEESWKRFPTGWCKTTRVTDLSPGNNSSVTVGSPSATENPPAPEYAERGLTSQDKQLYGIAKFKNWGGDYDTRQRTFDIPTAVSNDQLKECAQLLGEILQGRNNQVAWAMALPDELPSAYRPLRVVDWIEKDWQSGDFIKSRYLCDGDSWAHEAEQESLAQAGIYMGQIYRYSTVSPTAATTPLEDPLPTDGSEVEVVTPPYTQSFDVVLL